MGGMAWMSELKFHWQPFEDALTLRIATSARLAEEVLKEQARGIFRKVMDITPPGHEGVKAGGGHREGEGGWRHCKAVWQSVCCV
jgi:hypothetical protein